MRPDVRLLTEDCRFRAGNRPEVSGRTLAAQAAARFTRGFTTMGHDILRVTQAGDRTFVDPLLECGTDDGRTFLFPTMAELTRRCGELSSVLLYADVSDLA